MNENKPAASKDTICGKKDFVQLFAQFASIAGSISGWRTEDVAVEGRSTLQPRVQRSRDVAGPGMWIHLLLNVVYLYNRKTSISKVRLTE